MALLPREVPCRNRSMCFVLPRHCNDDCNCGSVAPPSECSVSLRRVTLSPYFIMTDPSVSYSLMQGWKAKTMFG
ncbi:hypothetical protein E2542_SST01061 [Spatholobus suberectus]|nr:hypothetical protein E2542_SST01061 [Spatholobus suberectus]